VYRLSVQIQSRSVSTPGGIPHTIQFGSLSRGGPRTAGDVLPAKNWRGACVCMRHDRTGRSCTMALFGVDKWNLTMVDTF